MDDKIRSIYFLLENRAIHAALMNIETLAIENNEGEIGDEVHQLLVSYNMMVSYTLQGIKDPNMQNMINNTLANAHNILERILKEIHLKNPESYIGKTYKEVCSENIPFDEIKKKLEMYTENMSTVNILFPEKDIEKKRSEIAKEHERIINYTFNKIYVSVKWDDTDFEQIKEILNSLIIIDEDKAIIVSAITLSLLHVLDAKKFNLLLSLYNHETPIVYTRALVGIVILTYLYCNKIQFYPEFVAQLATLKEDKKVVKDIRNIQLQLLMQLQTGNVNKRVSEKIMPNIIRGNDMIMHRRSSDIQDDNESENPDWEKYLYNPDISKSLQEMNELQSSGADIYMSTFSFLKNYSFFFKISHWFYPFYNHQYDVIPVLKKIKKDKVPYFDLIFNSAYFCNSDRYSLCLTFQNISSLTKNDIINELSDAKFEEMDQAELIKSFNENSKKSYVLSHQYIQDLYRFCFLWHHKSEERNIFNYKYDLWNNLYLSDIVCDIQTLKQAGALLLNYNHFEEALEVYRIINDKYPHDTESWQRSGYIYQKLKNYIEAINCYNRADILSPDQKWTLTHIAKCYRSIKDYLKAIDYYKKVEKLQPDNLSTLIEIGECYLLTGHYEEAKKCFFEAVYKDEKNIKAHRGLGWCMLHTKNYSEAIKHYNLVIELFTDLPFDYINLGHANMLLNNIDEAIMNYRKSSLFFKDNKEQFQAINDMKRFLTDYGLDKDYIAIITDLIF